jgi:hypothetical protein
MSDLIQALKENEKPFGLMSGKMRARARVIGELEFECYENSEKFEWGKLAIFDEYNFSQELTYRLRPDYVEKPKVVEIPVRIYQGSLHYQGIAGMRALASAPNYADFLGFKYDSGCVSPLPRIYRFGDGMGGSLHYTINHETLSEDDKWEVLTPTAVLFKGATK